MPPRSRLKDVKNPLPDYEDVPSAEKQGVRAWFRPGRLWIGSINIPGPMGADSSARYVFQVVEWNKKTRTWIVSHAAHGDEQLCHLKLDDTPAGDGSLGLSFQDAETSCVGSISTDGVISGTVGQLVRPEEDFWQKAGEDNTFELALASCEPGDSFGPDGRVSRKANAVKARVARLARWRCARAGLPLIFDGLECIRVNTGATDRVFTHIVDMRKATRGMLDPDPMPWGLVEWVIQQPPVPGKSDDDLIAETAAKLLGIDTPVTASASIGSAIEARLVAHIEDMAKSVVNGEREWVNVSERLERESRLVLADREDWVRSVVADAHDRLQSARLASLCGTDGSPGKDDEDVDGKELEEDEDDDGLQTHPVLDMSESEGESEDEEDDASVNSLPSLVDSDEESDGLEGSGPPSLISTDSDSDLSDLRELSDGDKVAASAALHVSFADWEEDDVYGTEEDSSGRGWVFSQILKEGFRVDQGLVAGERVWWRVWQTLQFACEAECCGIRERTRVIKEAKFTTAADKKAAVKADREGNGTRADIHATIGTALHRQYVLLWRSINFSELPDRDAQECNKTIVEMIHQSEHRMHIAYRAFDEVYRKFESRLPRSDVERRCVTVPPEGISAIPGFEDPESATCTICMTTANEPGERLCRLDCGHGFHLNCVENWLHNERTCPNCRTKVVGEGDAEEEEEERRQEDERRVQEDERVIQAAVARHVENRRSQRENRRIQQENAEGSAVEANGSSERALVERMMASQPAEMVAEMQRTLGPTGMNTMEAILRGDDVDDIVQESMANPEQLARDLGNLLRAQTETGRETVMPPFMQDIMEGIRDGLGDSDDDGLGDSEDDSFPEESSEGEWESDFDSEALDSDDSADSDEIAARAAEARVLIMNRMNAAMNGGDLSALDSADEALTEAMRVATAARTAARAARAVADAGLDSDEEHERIMEAEEHERIMEAMNAVLANNPISVRHDGTYTGSGLSDSDDSGPPELLDSDAEDESPDSEENARPRTRARMAARRAVRPPQRAWPPHEAQDVD